MNKHYRKTRQALSRAPVFVQQQQGAVLIVAMVFLLLITMVAVVGSRRATLELQMAGNDQARMEYNEYASALIDEVRNNAANLNMPDTKTNCDPNSTYTKCDYKTLAATKAYMTDTTDKTTYRVKNHGDIAFSQFLLGENKASGATGGGGGALQLKLFTINVGVVGGSSRSSASEMEYGFMQFVNADGSGGIDDRTKGDDATIKFN